MILIIRIVKYISMSEHKHTHTPLPPHEHTCTHNPPCISFFHRKSIIQYGNKASLIILYYVCSIIDNQKNPKYSALNEKLFNRDFLSL